MGLERDWRESVDRVESALDGSNTWQHIDDETDVILHIQTSPSFRPLKGWVVTKMAPEGDLEQERQRVFSFSEFPGEMDAFTFYPNTKAILGKTDEVVAANKEAMDVQMDTGLSAPNHDDLVEFFHVTEEIFRRSLHL